MIIYILKFSGCLLVLYTFYRFFLESEKNHKFKRFYLLFALVASVIIPLITLTYQVEAQPIQETGILVPETIANVENVKPSSWKDQIPAILWTVYSIGVVIFLLRFLGNISRLRRVIQKHEKVEEFWNIKVLLPFQQIPYSYFKYIFVEKDAFERNNIPKEILKHEEAHVLQKHTLDLLILEILQVIFWFNPLFFFIKKSIRLNHEFLADEAVLKQNISALSYSNLLLNSSFGAHQAAMTSSFKHSLIKKRIVMISNSFSKKRVSLKLGILVPVLCCCIYFFNNAIVAETMQQEPPIVTEVLEAFTLKIHGKKIELNGEQVSLENFASKLDKITDQFSDEDLLKNNIRLNFKNIPEDFKKKVGQEYLKTHYYQLMKKNARNSSLFNSNLPPPPPPPMQFTGKSGTSFITTDRPSEEQISEWKSKNVEFFYDDQPVSKVKLKDIDLNTVALYSKQIKASGTKIYLNTVYTQYSKNPPSKSILSDQNLKDYSHFFIDGKEVSKDKLKAYSPNNFISYQIVKDGKLPVKEQLILKFYTEEIIEVIEEPEVIEVIENHPKSPPSPQSPEVIEVIENEPTPPTPPNPEIIEVVEDVPNPPAPPKKPEVIENVSFSKNEEIIEVVEENLEENDASQEKSVKELIKEYNVQLKKVNLLLPEGYPMAYRELKKEKQDKIASNFSHLYKLHVLLSKKGAQNKVDLLPPPPPPTRKE
ncbi:M56 family metallopeptidase [Zunongwangia endophytica]|uniref:M56 family metallopeptidase n=1 Tax=Zunongwangia endophytica TaxID=1808945 RepID=A0ABV8H508_9FLAO|nr:M56 family metallopeptidase [Zunongwangia endophytica]MDN3594495.1 M56 family metallopeptidase [Zunongwangia endophytica]